MVERTRGNLKIQVNLKILYCWYCGRIFVSNTRGARFEPFYCNDKYFLSRSIQNWWKDQLLWGSLVVGTLFFLLFWFLFEQFQQFSSRSSRVRMSSSVDLKILNYIFTAWIMFCGKWEILVLLIDRKHEIKWPTSLVSDLNEFHKMDFVQ